MTDENRSVLMCIQGIGGVLSLILVNDIYHQRWFDVGISAICIAVALMIIYKIKH